MGHATRFFEIESQTIAPIPPEDRHRGGRALVAILVGVPIVLCFLFMGTTLYPGQFVDRLSGTDVAWLVEILAAGGVSWVLTRHDSAPTTALATANIEDAAR